MMRRRCNAYSLRAASLATLPAYEATDGVACDAVDCAMAAMAMHKKPAVIVTLSTYFITISNSHPTRRNFWARSLNPL